MGQGLGPVLLARLLERQGGHEQGEVQALQATCWEGLLGQELPWEGHRAPGVPEQLGTQP